MNLTVEKKYWPGVVYPGPVLFIHSSPDRSGFIELSDNIRREHSSLHYRLNKQEDVVTPSVTFAINAEPEIVIAFRSTVNSSFLSL